MEIIPVIHKYGTLIETICWDSHSKKNGKYLCVACINSRNVCYCNIRSVDNLINIHFDVIFYEKQ